MDKHQTTWAEFSLLPAPAIQVRRFDDSRSRFYWWEEPTDKGVEIKTAIGITSLLSMVMPENKGLSEWKEKHANWRNILRWAADYGTAMHTVFQHWLLHGHVPLEMMEAAREPVIAGGMDYDMPEKDLIAWAKFVEDYKVKAMVVEGMLVSETIEGERFCQAIDLLCEITVMEEKSVIVESKYVRGPKKGQIKKTKVTKSKQEVKKIACFDWKSNFQGKDRKSFYDSHKFQLMAAKKAVEHNYPDIKVDVLMNWAPNSWETKPSYSLKEWNITAKDERAFEAYIGVARARGLFKPNGSIFIPPDFNSGEHYSKFQMIGYERFIKEFLVGVDGQAV